MTNSADQDQLELIWIYIVCKDRAYPGIEVALKKPF